MWVQQFYAEAGKLRWREEKEGIPPSAVFISSLYDGEARYAKKHTTSWVGYKVHLTETCEDDEPRLITNVETTAGPIAERRVSAKKPVNIELNIGSVRGLRVPSRKEYEDVDCGDADILGKPNPTSSMC